MVTLCCRCQLGSTLGKGNTHLLDRLEDLDLLKAGEDDDGPSLGEGLAEGKGDGVNVREGEEAEDDVLALGHVRERNVGALQLARHVPVAGLDALGQSRSSG